MARRMTVAEARGWWQDLVGSPPTGDDWGRFCGLATSYGADRVEEGIGVVGRARLPVAKRMALFAAWFGEVL